MDYSQSFDLYISRWIKKISNNVDNNIKGDKINGVRTQYMKIESFSEILFPLIDSIPTEHIMWITGKDAKLAEDYIYALESIREGIYFLVSNMYISSNHSIRCALEQIISTVFSVETPNRGETPETTMTDRIKKVLEINMFYIFNKNKMFETDKKSYNLEQFIKNTYSELSTFVHSRDIFKKRKAVPVKTIDLDYNIEQYKLTLKNLSDTIDIFIIIISLSVKEAINKDILSKLCEKAKGHSHLEKTYALDKFWQ